MMKKCIIVEQGHNIKVTNFSTISIAGLRDGEIDKIDYKFRHREIPNYLIKIGH